MVTKNIHPLSSDDNEESLRQLFQRLDLNKDGKICVSDVVRVLREHHGEVRDDVSTQIAKAFLDRCGVEAHGELTFTQFAKYISKHDQQLAYAFKHLSPQINGHVTSENIQETFRRFGVNLKSQEADKLLHSIAPNGTMNYMHWREFLLFHPAESVAKIFEYWHHVSLDPSGDSEVCVSEDLNFPESPTRKHVLQFTAGGIAGAVSRTCTAPIDRLKLMRQVYGYKHKGSGFVDAYQYMLREGGFWSLWRGNGINVVKIAPETALKYGSYEHYKRFLTTSSDTNTNWLRDVLCDRPMLTQFVAGSLAGSTAQTIIYPLEVLKTRMCLRKTGQFHSIWHCARTIHQEYGICAFYRGYFVNLIGIIPYAGIELTLYEWSKTAYIRRFLSEHGEYSRPGDPPPHLPTTVVPLLASFASSCGIVATYPASLIRAKLQVVYWSQTTGTKVTATGLVRTIWREDGLVGLYRGMLTNLTKVLPAVSISLATYEALRRQFSLGPLGSG